MDRTHSRVLAGCLKAFSRVSTHRSTCRWVCPSSLILGEEVGLVLSTRQQSSKGSGTTRWLPWRYSIVYFVCLLYRLLQSMACLAPSSFALMICKKINIVVPCNKWHGIIYSFNAINNSWMLEGYKLRVLIKYLYGKQQRLCQCHALVKLARIISWKLWQ